MIKPESLWTLCKECPDSKWVGDILRKLGGQDVALDFGQQQMFKAISQDSEWMDERIEKNRERERQRKVAYRARLAKEGGEDVPRCPTLSQGQTGVPHHPSIQPSIQPSIHPTNHPTIHPSVSVSNTALARTHARMDVPTLETVVSACEVTGVPTWYAKWWHAEMVSRDWTKVDGSSVGNRNWRPVLKSWWNRDEKDATHLQEIRAEFEAKPVVKQTYPPEDWSLCAERCGNFCDGRCTKGVSVPPIKWEWPTPPEECKRFEVKG